MIFVSKFKENEYLHLLSLDVIKAFIVFLVCLSILCMVNAILYYLSISKILDLGIVTFIPLPVLIITGICLCYRWINVIQVNFILFTIFFIFAIIETVFYPSVEMSFLFQ